MSTSSLQWFSAIFPAILTLTAACSGETTNGETAGSGAVCEKCGTGGTAGSGGTSGTAGTAGTAGTGGTSGTAGTPNGCEIVEHAVDDCAGASPCVTLNADVRCGNPDFAASGLQTIALADRIGLSTADSTESRLFALAPSNSHQVDVPLTTYDNLVLMAMQPDGSSLGLIVDSTDPSSSNYAGGLSYASLTNSGQAGLTELVYDSPSTYVSPLGFAVAHDGTAHTWHHLDESSTIVHSSRDSSGQWHQDSVGVPSSNPIDFSLTPDGVPVGFYETHEGSYTSLFASVGDQSEALSMAVSDVGPRIYLPAPAPQPYAVFDAEIPAYGLALVQGNGIRLGWSLSSGAHDASIPNTAGVSPHCPTAVSTGNYPTGECPENCAETSTGLEIESGVIGVARLESGDFVVAYVQSELNRTMGYDKQCNDGPTMCACVSSIKNDASQYTLHVVTVSANSTVTERFNSQIDAPIVAQGKNALLSLSAYGSSVSVAYRQADTAPNSVKIRVLRIDL